MILNLNLFYLIYLLLQNFAWRLRHFYMHLPRCAKKLQKTKFKLILFFPTFFVIHCWNCALSSGIRHYFDTDSLPLFGFAHAPPEVWVCKFKILNEIKQCGVQDNAWIRNEYCKPNSRWQYFWGQNRRKPKG